MNLMLSGEPYKRPYRYFMAVLFISVNACAMLPYVAPSMLMGDIMQTYGVDYALAGLGMTIQLVAAGVCFFIGSLIADRIGYLKNMQLCLWSLFLGVFITAIAPNIQLFLLGRIIAGFGQGLSVAMSPLMTAWFAGKELSLLQTFNSMGSAIAIAISIAICRSLSDLTGSWQGPFFIYAVITLLFALLWTFGGKNSPEGIQRDKETRMQKAAAGKTPSALSMAIKEPQYWKAFVYIALITVVNTSVQTFMPSFMMQELAVSETATTSATSIQSLVGLVGSFCGGLLVTKLWCRKPIMYTFCGIYILCGFAITWIHIPSVSVFLCVALGFLYFIQQTAQFQLLIETALAKNPAMMTGGSAITSGTGMILTLFVSPIFSTLTNAYSMAFAYRIFFTIMIIGFCAIFTLTETGRRPIK